ncbi:uncharacterized protein LOC141492363 [Macrotis lagotis]|uniref:uncharacterized protein LOC141492363 n=1 Tax=Macrotis lagotis TaxID=92651 RepID=UPI003D6965CA
MLNDSLCFSTPPSVAFTEPGKGRRGGMSSAGSQHPKADSIMLSSNIHSESKVPSPNPAPLDFPEAKPASGGAPSLRPRELRGGSLRTPRSARVLRRSSSVASGSPGLEAFLERKTVAGGSGGPEAGKAADAPPGRKLTESRSPDSTPPDPAAKGTGGGSGARRTAPLRKPGPSAWRCRGPFSRCCLSRGREDAAGDAEGLRLGPPAPAPEPAAPPAATSSPCRPAAEARLARIGALKDCRYAAPGGFLAAQRDAHELLGLVRACAAAAAAPPPWEASGARAAQRRLRLAQCKRLLSAESDQLGSACGRMAAADTSPEDMLAAVSAGFRALCCLTEACLRLLGLASAEAQRREMAAKIDEVVINYICLLRAAEAAAEAAAGRAPAAPSLRLLARRSSAMAALLSALTRSLKAPPAK